MSLIDDINKFVVGQKLMSLGLPDFSGLGAFGEEFKIKSISHNNRNYTSMDVVIVNSRREHSYGIQYPYDEKFINNVICDKHF